MTNDFITAGTISTADKTKELLVMYRSPVWSEVSHGVTPLPDELQGTLFAATTLIKAWRKLFCI